MTTCSPRAGRKPAKIGAQLDRGTPAASRPDGSRRRQPYRCPGRPMHFEKAVSLVSTVTDLRRVATAHVIDHTQLEYDELRTARPLQSAA